MPKGEVNPGLAAYNAEKKRVADEKRAGEARAILAARDEPPAEGEQNDEPPAEVSSDLASVFRVIQEARKAKSSEEALALIRRALSQLSDKDKDILIASDEFQRVVDQAATTGPDKLAPGSYVRDSEGRIIRKVGWSVDDIKERSPMVTWMPIESRNITFAGHTIRVEAGVEAITPAVFKDIYDNAQAEVRSQHQRNMDAVGRTAGIPTFDVGWYKEPVEE